MFLLPTIIIEPLKIIIELNPIYQSDDKEVGSK